MHSAGRDSEVSQKGWMVNHCSVYRRTSEERSGRMNCSVYTANRQLLSAGKDVKIIKKALKDKILCSVHCEEVLATTMESDTSETQ